MMKISEGFRAQGCVSLKNHNLHPAKRAHRNIGHSRIIVGGMTSPRNVKCMSQEGNSEATMSKEDAIFPLSGPSPERFKVQAGETNNVRQIYAKERIKLPSVILSEHIFVLIELDLFK